MLETAELTAARYQRQSATCMGGAQGKSNQNLARQLGTTNQTVCKWRASFVASRLEGLADEVPARCALHDHRRDGREGGGEDPRVSRSAPARSVE